MKTSSEKISARIARNAKPRERDIRDALDARVKQYGGEARAVAWLGRVGAPDVLCLFPESPLEWIETAGRWARRTEACACWVETKMTGGKLTACQRDEHAALAAGGQSVMVIVTMADLDAWLPELP